MKLKIINAGFIKVDGGAFFGVVPKILWQRLLPADENNLVPNILRLLLIDDEQHVILIDTGLGTKLNKKLIRAYSPYGNHALTEILKQNGYLPEQITDVILTHLHADHCGGAVHKDQHGALVPTFPNAHYWVSRLQWEQTLNPNPREKAAFIPDNYIPLKEAGLLSFIDQDTELYTGIYLKHHFGHTTGLLAVHIHLDDAWIIYPSDFLPTAYHVYEPYIMSYDICAQKTMEEKEEFFKWITSVKHCIIFGHDPNNECGVIYKDKKGHKVKDTCTLEQFLDELQQS